MGSGPCEETKEELKVEDSLLSAKPSDDSEEAEEVGASGEAGGIGRSRCLN